MFAVDAGFILEAGQELDTACRHDGRTPAVSTGLTCVRVVTLGGELAHVDVTSAAAGAPEQHWNWFGHLITFHLRGCIRSNGSTASSHPVS